MWQVKHPVVDVVENFIEIVYVYITTYNNINYDLMNLLKIMSIHFMKCAK
jgi:hypothetical protein